MTDLSFICDGNPRLIEDKINFNRCRMISRCIMSLYKSLPSDYETDAKSIEIRDSLIRILAGKLPDEKVLYDTSLLREPRENK